MTGAMTTSVLEATLSLKDFRLHVHTVAHKLGCSTRTVRRLIDSGDLKAIRKTPRNTRISEESFSEYVKRCLSQSDKEVN